MIKIKQLWSWLITPYIKYKSRKQFERRLKELREKDPFIYK